MNHTDVNYPVAMSTDVYESSQTTSVYPEENQSRGIWFKFKKKLRGLFGFMHFLCSYFPTQHHLLPTVILLHVTSLLICYCHIFRLHNAECLSCLCNKDNIDYNTQLHMFTNNYVVYCNFV